MADHLLVEAARLAAQAGERERALELYETAFGRVVAGGRGEVGAEAADLLRWLGNVRREFDELELAEELYEASVAVARAQGLLGAHANGLNCLAILSQSRGDLDAAERRYAEALEMATEAGDDALLAMISQNWGIVANIRGDLSLALERYGAALRGYRRLEDDLMSARCLNNMGMAHVDREQWESAAACFDQASGLAHQEQDLGLVATVELNRAELNVKLRRFEAARESCDRAFEVFSRLDLMSGQAEAHKLFGVLFRETDKPHQAVANLNRAVALARECEDVLLEAESEHERALALRGLDRNPEALQCLTRAHALFEQLRARRDMGSVSGRLDDLEDAFLEVVRRWAESIESKDNYTAGHCERVAQYACRLAEAVGFEGRDLKWFRMGAFLHDVGKTGVRDAVLNKPGKLTDDEWAEMRDHTVIGDRIVRELNFPWHVGHMVRSHHERWNGSGYPDRLAGEEIPLVARILCVADVYDALTTTRSYRAALSPEEALDIMARESGETFEPRLFEAFRELMRPAEARPSRGAIRLVS